MKKLPVLILALILVSISYAQITIINTGTTEHLTSVSFINKNILVSGYKSYLAKSYNECNTLIPLNVPTFPNSNYSFSVDRVDTSILYMTTSSFANLNLIIWKSLDGGHTWLKKIDTTSTNMYSGVTRFFDKIEGVSFCQNQGSLITKNGLNTYSFGAWSNTFPKVAELYGDSTIILGSCGGAQCGMEISNDRGNTWTKGNGTGIYTPIDFEFISKDTIVCITDMALWSSYISVTFNGGTTWKNIEYTGEIFGTPPAEGFSKLCAKKGGEVYITGRTGLTSNGFNGYGIILKTNDFGKTWSSFVTPFKTWFSDMKFINDSIALVTGGNGLLFKWNSKQAVFTGLERHTVQNLNIAVSPNPVKDKIRIELSKSGTIKKLLIKNIMGQTIFEIAELSPEIDISFLKTGVYFLNFIDNENRQSNIKIIKE